MSIVKSKQIKIPCLFKKNNFVRNLKFRKNQICHVNKGAENIINTTNDEWTIRSETENISKWYHILVNPELGLDLKYTENMLATQRAWPSEWPFRNQHIGY